MPNQHNKRKHICKTTDKGECKESMYKIHCLLNYESYDEVMFEKFSGDFNTDKTPTGTVTCSIKRKMYNCIRNYSKTVLFSAAVLVIKRVYM